MHQSPSPPPPTCHVQITRTHDHMSREPAIKRELGTKRERDRDRERPSGRGLRDEDPSETLYIPALPTGMNEADFIALFNKFPGFREGRIRSMKNGGFMGFVDYENTKCATHARDNVKGMIINRFELQVRFSQTPSKNSKRRREDEFLAASTGGQTASTVPPPTADGERPATDTLFVEGIPEDATEREIAHMFRHFPGYFSLSIPPQRNKGLSRTCFVQFENELQATVALQVMQNYQVDLKTVESNRLMIKFAKQNRVRR